MSYRFYEDFEFDSSLNYAAQALDLSNKLFQLEGFDADEPVLSRIRTLKVQSYVVYARAIRGNNIQAAEDSLLVCLNLIGESGSPSDKAALYSELGSTYDRKGQNDKALQHIQMALELYEKSGEQAEYMQQLLNLGLVLRVMGKYGESLEYLMESLKIGRQIEDSAGIVESLLAMGFVYAFVEKYDDALKCQEEALTIYQEANDLWGIARIHYDMGVTYSFAGEMDSALAHHLAALEIRLKSNDAYNTFASYLSIGDIFAESGNFSEAIEYYENGIPYGMNAAYITTVVDAYLRLGGYYLMLPDEEKSLFHYNNALQLSQEIGHITGQTRAAMGLAKISLGRKEYADALTMLKQAERTAPQTILNHRKIIYKDIAEAYAILGDHKKAYLNSLIYSDLKDSVSAAENLGMITRLTNVLEFENKMALQKESNEKMMAIQQAQITRERNNRNIFLSGMILALVVVIITFIRFVEKKKLSAKLNETLNYLRETQTQLVHAEKMASLGELTAGIAHEIQNPLNFVNNFSEVSSELMDEMKEELDKGEYDEAKSIASDIKQNLEKITHHGKRADGIVKGMLQHSRSSAGQKELTDINILADEYLRLSFYGLRAKDKTFNAHFKTDFDPKLPKIEVIPQDIGRVLLNLINNAFYAVSEKERNRAGLDHPESYKPTVIVSTKFLEEKIEISVKDNGNGIPEEIKNRIFQPFFTTKPSGEGTGLGLSLSYDIVKAHGGELNVVAQKGEGSIFTMVFPI